MVRGKGFLVLLFGATHLVEDHSTIPVYVQPVQPVTAPTGLPTQPSAAELRATNNAIKILNCNWAVVNGFLRAMGKNIHDTINAEFYEDLQHQVYGYDGILPINHFDKIDQHVLLDKPAIKECRNNYLRGW